MHRGVVWRWNVRCCWARNYDNCSIRQPPTRSFHCISVGWKTIAYLVLPLIVGLTILILCIFWYYQRRYQARIDAHNRRCDELERLGIPRGCEAISVIRCPACQGLSTPPLTAGASGAGGGMPDIYTCPTGVCGRAIIVPNEFANYNRQPINPSPRSIVVASRAIPT